MKMTKRTKKVFAIYCTLALMITLFAVPVYAANDPLTVVNNLSDFIFGLIRAIGMILLGFGIVQIGLSLKSHDPSQRANGFLTLAYYLCKRDSKSHYRLMMYLTFRGNRPVYVCSPMQKKFYRSLQEVDYSV